MSNASVRSRSVPLLSLSCDERRVLLADGCHPVAPIAPPRHIVSSALAPGQVLGSERQLPSKGAPDSCRGRNPRSVCGCAMRRVPAEGRDHQNASLRWTQDRPPAIGMSPAVRRGSARSQSWRVEGQTWAVR